MWWRFGWGGAGRAPTAGAPVALMRPSLEKRALCAVSATVGWLALALTVRAAVAGVAAQAGFCERFTLRDSGVLQWARRPNEEETVRVGGLLRLRCCARHYDNILWFREDVRLPSARASSLLELADGNRTLQSPAAQARDAGRYACVAHNRTAGRSLAQLFRVVVRVEESLDNKVLQDTYEVRTQRVGDKIKIDCSMITEDPVVWFRDDTVNKTFPFLSKGNNKLSNVKVKPIESFANTSKIKETRKVKGQSIIIDPIQPENFGKYECYQNKTEVIRTVILKEGGYRKELKVAVICLVILFITSAILIPFLWFWRLEIRLLWKDRFGKLEENDDKVYDIFVSHDAADASFVLGVLVPVLEDHFHYRCFAWERDSIAGDWIPETLVQSIRDSRRFLMILSPALLENRWCTFALHIALKAVLQMHLHIICVKLQDIDWSQVQLADKTANETIRQVLHVVRTVVWEPNKSMVLHNQQLVHDKNVLNFYKATRKRSDISEDDIQAPGRSRFWRKLRLYLPPRRTLPLLSKPPASPTSTKSLLSLHQCPDC